MWICMALSRNNLASKVLKFGCKAQVWGQLPPPHIPDYMLKSVPLPNMNTPTWLFLHIKPSHFQVYVEYGHEAVCMCG